MLNCQDHIMRYFIIYNPGLWYKNRLTGSRKELAIRPIPAYIVVDITVEYNQEMRLKLSRK